MEGNMIAERWLKHIVIVVMTLLVMTMAKKHEARDHVDIAYYVSLGKTDWGWFYKQLTCPSDTKVAGFRIKVGAINARDRIGLNGIQLACTDGSVTEKASGTLGVWEKWLYCDEDAAGENYIVGFNYRSQKSQGYRIDDLAGTNLKMNCSNNVELLGKGFDMGTWDRIEYATCANGTYFCGVQPELEKEVHVDNSAMNRNRYLCCRPKKDPCVDTDHEQCQKWIMSGYCTTTSAYVKGECCKSCGDHLKTLKQINCTDKAGTKMCGIMSKEGKCLLPEYFPWAVHICCQTCRKITGFGKLLQEHNLKFEDHTITILEDAMVLDDAVVNRVRDVHFHKRNSGT